jgi:hypothetical protein
MACWKLENFHCLLHRFSFDHNLIFTSS